MSDATTPAPDHEHDQTTPSRRAALRLLGAAAAGAAASAIAGSGQADAANGDAIVLGSVGNVASAPTGTAMSNGSLQNYGFGITDNGLTIPTPSPGPQNAAILGHAAGTAFTVAVGAFAVGKDTRGVGVAAQGEGVVGVDVLADGVSSAGVRGQAAGEGSVGVIGTGDRGVYGAGDNGVYGYSEGAAAVVGEHYGTSGAGVSAFSQAGDGIRSVSANGSAVRAAGRFGGLFQGTDAALVLAPTTDPTTRPGWQDVGRLAVDQAGNLWVSVTSGGPGTWRKLAGPSTAGAFHPITPTRVYDSRQALPGPAQPIASGQTRTVSVRDGRAVAGGAVTVPNLVPVGATAIAVNIGIVSIAGPGNLVANPGGVTAVTSSSINWTAAGQILANGIIARVSASRELTLIVGGPGTTHVFLDVTGYFL